MNSLLQLLLADKSDPYLRAADRWISNAFRPATKKQHSYVIRLYVGFAHKTRYDYLNPSEDLVVSFLVFLTQNYKTQKVVRSMFSTLRACLLRAHFNVTAFDSTRASLFVRSIGINKRTPTRQRPPIDARVLKNIVTYWRGDGIIGHTLAAAAIMMFVTSLRQSNLFPTSKCAFDPTRQLVWSDLVWRPDYVKVKIKWGKAQQKTVSRFQKIPRASDPALCLFSALQGISRPRDRQSQPIFSFPDGTPLPISYVSKRWASATTALGLQSVGFTMHSLRRGGARYLQDMGVHHTNIASHGGWRSRAIYDYIREPGHQAAQSALKRLC